MPSATSPAATSTRRSRSGWWSGGGSAAGDLLPYVVAQVAGAIAGAAILYLIASGKAGFDCRRRLRLERLRRPFARRLLDDRGAGGRGRHDLLLPDDHPRRHRRTRAERLRADRDRPRPHAHPPDQHPGDQHLGESGAQHRPGGVRRRLGACAALAVLGGAAARRALPPAWCTGWSAATAARPRASKARPALPPCRSRGTEVPLPGSNRAAPAQACVGARRVRDRARRSRASRRPRSRP